MKQLLKILPLLIFFTACEDVIDLEIKSEKPKLVIDAIIEVDRSMELVPVIVSTSLSSGFSGQNMPQSVTSVKFWVESLNEFGDTESTSITQLEETSPGSGIYKRFFDQQTFNTELVYYLSVTYNDRFYFSRTKFIPATTIDSVEQGEEFLLDEDETEIIISFTDDSDISNLYVVNIVNENLLTVDDQFIDGEYSFSYFLDENLMEEEYVTVKLWGADREFFNYIDLLVEQSNQNFTFFDTPAATIRGNIFDFTDIDNRDQFDNTGATDTFPLGYFAVVESDRKTIMID